MNNKEFIELSEKEVKNLNASEHEESNEAWRAGYIYLAEKIKESMQNDNHDEFITKLEDIADGESELEIFKFLVKI